MHELVRERLRAQADDLVLEQLPLDEGALIAAFTHRKPSLQWIAKTAYGPAAVRRLRAEADALQVLAPLAELLGLPRRLGFQEAAAGEPPTACLVQSAVPGRPASCRWGESAWSEEPAEMRAALAWLRRFQQGCASLPSMGATQEKSGEPLLRALGDVTIVRTEAMKAEDPESAALMHWVPEVLLPPARDCVAIPTHGDFWCGNVLLRRPALAGLRRVSGVVDWSSFTYGSALDDLLTWTGSMPDRAARARPRADIWTERWLRPGRGRHRLRAWAEACGYDPVTARYAFYLFLARRLCWELGFSVQFRSAAERQWARGQWIPLLQQLEQTGYPDPFASPLA